MLLRVCLKLTLILAVMHRAEAAQFECDHLTETTPRGLMCLHCLMESASDSARAITDALLRSCQKNIAIGFALDGAFGNTTRTLFREVERLTEAGRRVYLHLYLLNGPAQRRAYGQHFRGFYNNRNPHEFRAELVQRQFRRAFRRFLQRRGDIFALSTHPSVFVSVAPMLEDNLSDTQFKFILELTQKALTQFPAIRYARNPCRDCFIGNGGGIPSDVLSEQHLIEAKFDTTDGIVSNDGWGYVYFPGDTPQSVQRPVDLGDRREEAIALEEMGALRDRATAQNDIFLLWIAKYQQTEPGSRSVAPQLRHYPTPTEREVGLMAEFLA